MHVLDRLAGLGRHWSGSWVFGYLGLYAVPEWAMVTATATATAAMVMATSW